ncbi:MAG: serine kinase [Rhodothermales bacterium]
MEMFSYRAYTLTIHSDIKLAGLPLGAGPPDATIVRRRLSEAELSASSREGLSRGRIYDDLEFLIEDGTRMVIDMRAPMGDDLLCSYVLGPLLSILLRQRGLFVVHACCVARDGEAIGFLGESGWGKSTLTEFFCQRGYSLVTDDVLAVDLTAGERPHAVPGYPHIRLLPGAGGSLMGDFQALPLVFEGGLKRLLVRDEMPETPLPLKKLYLLNEDYAPAHAITPLSASEVVRRLIRHTRVMHVMTSPPVLAHHLGQCSELVRSVPISELHRKASFAALPALFDLVERDLEALVPRGAVASVEAAGN